MYFWKRLDLLISFIFSRKENGLIRFKREILSRDGVNAHKISVRNVCTQN